VLGVIGRRLAMAQLLQAVEGAVVTAALLFAIIIGATYFANFVVQTQLPQLLAGAAKSLHLPGLAVMMIIIVAYVAIGCFLEGIGMVLITVPVFLPLVVQYGYDPVWFSIIVVIVVELGLIHPPVGMNLFVIQAQVPDIRLGAIYRGILPFLIAPFVLLALLLLFPQLARWLPKVLYG
jgi:TRAP-type C4-dicarboxylate transport system permease large subunit